MRNIHVQGVRPDESQGHLLVTVNPLGVGSVSIQVNDHIEAPREDGASPQKATPFFTEAIDKGFHESLKRSEGIIDGLIDNFLMAKGFDDGIS